MADGAGLQKRLGVRAQGAVQGVGFRPCVYRVATALGLSGFVRNDAQGVMIEVEGALVEDFVDRLWAELPPLARIDALSIDSLDPSGEAGFSIVPSAAGQTQSARPPPDAGICGACVAELFDPANRRFGYPFIACCDCGPRFSMTQELPYDRPQTAMAAFPLCTPCAEEYADPATRRFHAEPTCCAACGPRYREDPAAIASRLAAGEIVAVKGVGGYHLMADARNAEAVARLRARKERSGKPFAVMAANTASVRQFALLDEEEEALLQSPARPIVLLRIKGPALTGVSPGLDTVGVMLPATPLHWLLFHASAGRPVGAAWRSAPIDPLFVCTSANPGGEPLITDDQEAEEKLQSIADAIIPHDRPIIVRVDDSVVRSIAGKPHMIRRGRGHTPEPIALPFEMPPTVAFGAHMKAAVCVTRGSEAFLAQHVGDLDNPATVRFHQETAAHLMAILAVKPERVACDLHPDFVSTRRAESQGLPLVRVQHHHAHALACAAENRLEGAFLALALDGFGFGPGGEAWGGELLLVDGAAFSRLGGLAPLPAPGGDRAAIEPWRMAAGALSALGRGHEIAQRFADQPLAGAIAAVLDAGKAGQTSSCGRLFDAAAGLLKLAVKQSYEAEAAMRLESLAAGAPKRLAIHPPASELVFSPLPLLEALIDAEPRRAARAFHEALAAGLAGIAVRAAAQRGLDRVALTGGCLANRLLAEALIENLQAAGLRPFTHSRTPCGDGGIALGQAFAAGLSMEV
jgi:hydrogenase maturation protein HypF